MLISKEVEVKLGGINIKHFENKGYELPTYIGSKKKICVKKGEVIKVKVKDLNKGSHALVDVKCDCEDCENPFLKPMTYNTYNKFLKEDGKYYCKNCALKLYGTENYRKTRLKNSISFYDWCYENLSKEKADRIMERWDYEKNIKNGEVLNPQDIGFSSNGFNKKGYWFKCLDHPEHESELKNINNFTCGEKSLDCIKCSTISVTHPQYIVYLVNKEDACKYTYGSSENISMICPNCGYKKETNIVTLINQGFACPRCSSGKSFPEKFMFNFLEQLFNNDFQTQLSRKTFEWCNNFRYDFYVDIVDCIIETHGLQHYECGFERIKSSKKHTKTLKEIQENDKIKEKLAKDNGIINYIVLDCRYSKLEWIKNSILHSKLNDLFDLSLIDWNKCYEYTCNSLVKIACDHWSNGIRNINQIANIIKINRNTIIEYLKRGVELGWCNYNAKEESTNNLKMMHKNSCKKIICITTGEIFNSMKDAEVKYDINNIYFCCKGRCEYVGKLPNGTKLKWMYYDEYVKLQNNNLLII